MYCGFFGNKSKPRNQQIKLGYLLRLEPCRPLMGRHSLWSIFLARHLPSTAFDVYMYACTVLVKAPNMSVTIIGPLGGGGVQLPFYSFKVPAGFPPPAADHLEQHISIDELLDIRAPHIYLVRIEGHSMEGAGIFDGDMALVDRSITAEH